MELKDITPSSMNCGIGACPAIFETRHGTYVLIGKRLSAEEAEELRARTAVDEVAIEIPQELVSKIGQ
jgi:hypothetical protein